MSSRTLRRAAALHERPKSGRAARINGVKSKHERQERIVKVMEEVKMTPVDDFLPQVPAHAQRWPAAAHGHRPGDDHGTQLLVADEPVSMLDASVRVEILRLLRGLQVSHNLAVIFITHDLSTVRYFSERIFVMYAGNLVEKCKVDELLRNPLHPYTRPCSRRALTPIRTTCSSSRRCRRRAAQPDQAAAGLPVPSPLLAHDRRPVQRRGAPDFEPSPDHLTACWLYK